jgi:hypothetical protein
MPLLGPKGSPYRFHDVRPRGSKEKDSAKCGPCSIPSSSAPLSPRQDPELTRGRNKTRPCADTDGGPLLQATRERRADRLGGDRHQSAGLGLAICPGIRADEWTRGWSEITAAVGAAGAPIITLLWHMGRARPQHLVSLIRMMGNCPTSRPARCAPTGSRVCLRIIARAQGMRWRLSPTASRFTSKSDFWMSASRAMTGRSAKQAGHYRCRSRSGRRRR